MAPTTSGASATKAQAGHHQALPAGSSSALGSKDSAVADATEPSRRIDASLHDSLHGNHENLNPITALIKSHRSGSGLTYDPLQRFLDETPHEQPWSTLACFAKGAEENTPSK